MNPKTMTHDTLIGSEYWVRCPYCGDSEHDPHKAHYSVNLSTGQYYCFRCNTGGVLEGQDWVMLLDMLMVAAPRAITKGTTNKSHPLREIRSQLKPGAGLPRHSVLSRQHLEVQEGKVDVFDSKTLEGHLEGYHLRASWNKIGLTYGGRAFGFSGSSFTSPWCRLVEGPYDALDPAHDLVTFGFPVPSQIKALRGLLIVLCPDGDVWLDTKKTWAYFKPFLKSPIKSSIIGVEYLPEGLDPDEVPISKRTRLSLSEALSKHLTKKTPLWQLQPQHLSIPTQVDLDPFWM